MTALFVMAPAYGHLNATFRLARQLQSKDYQVLYTHYGSPDIAQHIKKQGFSIHWLESYPFGIGFDEIQHQQHSESYLETLFDRFTGRDLKTRTADWNRTLAIIKPDLILIDAFLSTDFIVLYPFLQTYPAKVVLIQTMLSTYDDGYTPPLNSDLIPGQDSPKSIRQAWKKQYRLRWIWRFLQSIKYFGYSPYRQVLRAFKQNRLPDFYQLREDKLFHVGINNLPEWVMAPHMFDFAKRPEQPHQHYLGMMPDLDRYEELPPNYQTLLAKLISSGQSNSDQKILYASLGTETKAHLKQHQMQRLFEQLLLAISVQPNWQLLLVVGAGLKHKFINVTSNAHILEQVPQLHLLRRCDLFITHGGLNSILEAVALDVPMIVFPLNRRWDQAGNGARVVAQGKGLVGDLNKVTAKNFTYYIKQLISSSEKKIKTL